MQSTIVIFYILYQFTTGQIPQSSANAECPWHEVQSIIGLPPSQPITNSHTPKCYLRNERVNDFEGMLQCDYYSCCLCSSISCGINGTPCQYFTVSDKGAIGVQSIVIDGGAQISSTTPNLPGYIPPPGAIIECSGVESCKSVNMFTRNVQSLSCDSMSSCQDSNIILSDPAPNFGLYCNGQSSCQGTNIIINIGQSPPKGMVCNPSIFRDDIIIGPFTFHGELSAKSASLTINNNGCSKVLVSSIICTQSTSCPDTRFFFNGDVELQQCQDFNGLALLPQQLQSCYTGLPRLTCLYAAECANIIRTIRNPSSGFMLECLATDSCRGLQLTLDYGPSNVGYITEIAEFRFDQANAANGAIIKIENNQLSGASAIYAQRYPMKLSTITCATSYSCTGLTIIAGVNVDILDTFIDCTMEPNACNGCIIRIESMNNREYPCDYKTVYSMNHPSNMRQPIIPQFIPRSNAIPQFVPSTPIP